MHLLMFSLKKGGERGGGERGAGIPWGLDSQVSCYLQEVDRQLCRMGGTIDVSARKSRKNYVLILKAHPKLCNMGRELDPNFSKWSNFLSPTPALLGKTLIGAIE